MVQGPPSGCVRREFSGVAQVDEKGHAGNIAVVRSCLNPSERLGTLGME